MMTVQIKTDKFLFRSCDKISKSHFRLRNAESINTGVQQHPTEGFHPSQFDLLMMNCSMRLETAYVRNNNPLLIYTSS